MKSAAATFALEGIAQGQNPSSYQVEELHLAAMHFASFALLSPTFFTCGDWAALPAAEQKRCAWASIERFAERAWRRPLDAEERERIETFWRTNLAAGPANEAVALTVAGILQAPAFHFRLERGDAPGRETDALGAGNPPLLFPLGLDARRRAVRGGRGRRTGDAGGRRAAGAPDAGRPEGQPGANRRRHQSRHVRLPVPPAHQLARDCGAAPAARPDQPLPRVAVRSRRAGPSATTWAACACPPRTRRYGPGSGCSDRRPPATRRHQRQHRNSRSHHSRHSRHSGLSLFRHWGDLLGIA